MKCNVLGILLSLVLLCGLFVMSGYIGIPVGSEVVHVLTWDETGKCNQYTPHLYNKTLVIGIFPGIGSHWWAGQTVVNSFLRENGKKEVSSFTAVVGDSTVVTAVSGLFNFSFFGGPTIVSWLSYGIEPGFSGLKSWEPIDPNKWSVWPEIASLFGYAKTGKTLPKPLGPPVMLEFSAPPRGLRPGESIAPDRPHY